MIALLLPLFTLTLARPAAAEEIVMAPEEELPDDAPMQLWTSRSWFAHGGVDLLGPSVIRLGALRAWERSAHHVDGFAAIGMFGGGPRVELHLPPRGEAPVVGVAGVGRFATLGDGGPIGMEVGAGGLVGSQGVAGFFSAGAYLSVYYADVGYLLQMPVVGESPDWLGQHGVSLRVAIPVKRVAEPEHLGPFGLREAAVD